MGITEQDARLPEEVIQQLAEGRLATEQMILNVGPQHPATHGVFRLLATIDGEMLVDAEPIVGYMHRGYEKLVEQRDYRQITNLVSRMDWLSGINNELRQAIARLPDYEDLLTGNEIFKGRTINVGVLSKERAYQYGVTGPIGRGSDIDMDVRRDEPYLVYDQFDWEVQSASHGDCFDRFWVLLHEVVESAKIVEQAIEGVPSGPVLGKVPRVIQAPEGEVYVRCENPLGELGMYLVSDGDRRPYRIKIRTPSFSNVSALRHILRGTLVADMIAILGSFFFVLGDVDR